MTASMMLEILSISLYVGMITNASDIILLIAPQGLYMVQKTKLTKNADSPVIPYVKNVNYIFSTPSIGW